MSQTYVQLGVRHQPKAAQQRAVLVRRLDRLTPRRRLERQSLRRRGHARDMLELGAQLANGPGGCDAPLRSCGLRDDVKWDVGHGGQ